MNFKKFSIRLLIKEILKKLLFFKIFLLTKFPKHTNTPKIFYGGSRSGNIGGPLVKIKKLKELFPEYKYRFNIIYAISSNYLLSDKTIKILKSNNFPIILNQNGVFYPAWFKGNYQKMNLINKFLYHSADYVFWQSEFCKKASDKFLGQRRGSGEILYNAVNTDIFKPILKTNNNFNFLITGNISKNNNYRISSVLKALIDVLKYEPKANLIIAGNIHDKKSLVLKALKLGIINNVKFLGKFSQNDAPKIYQMADAYITLTYQDNCPTAVIEAMSCGLPILYSASGGIPEIVDKNSGIGLKVDTSWESIQIPDSKEISKGMINILKNKNKMSEFSRKRAIEKFDIKYWNKRHAHIFNYYLRRFVE